MNMFTSKRLLAIFLVQWLININEAKSEESEFLSSPLKASDTTENVEPQHIKFEEFDKAAVVSDSEQCSNVGKDILQQGGSAVDAAIAVLFCIGTVQFYFSGVGGGGFMLIYKRDEKKMYGFDYRETVPANAKKSVFQENKKKKLYGGVSVAVPGEIKGLMTVWKKFGKLKWAKLVQPSIDIARKGFTLKELNKEEIEKADDYIRKLVLKEEKPTMIFKSRIERADFARTLEKIRDDPNSMYEGDIAETIVADIKAKSGVMTLDDLKDYKVKEREPLSMKLGDLTLHTLPLPTGGPVLIHILKMCREFNFTKEDLTTKDKLLRTYHRIVEAFKFANAYRPHLCDPEFPIHKDQFKKFYKEMLDSEVAKNHSKMINDSTTHDIPFYSKLMSPRDDHGTAHVAILAENGDAVSVTESINERYGAHFASESLGLIYNDQLADTFTVDSIEHQLSSSEENSPRPFVRPLSGMAPSIILDSKGDVKMVVGAAGGPMIPASVAWITMMRLWFDIDIGNALMMSRPHHRLFPNFIHEEMSFPMKPFIESGLRKKNHKVQKSVLRSVCNVIYRDGKSKKLHSKPDPRRSKNDKAAGY